MGVPTKGYLCPQETGLSAVRRAIRVGIARSLHVLRGVAITRTSVYANVAMTLQVTRTRSVTAR